MTTAPDCAQPAATIALAFGLGSLLGAAWVGHKLLFPYRLHRPPRR